MKKSRVIVYITVCVFTCHFLVFGSVVYGQENPEAMLDCTEVSVNYSDDSSLTREERLRIMDKAFFESLNKFDLCQSAKKNSVAAGAAGGNGAGAEGGAEDTAGLAAGAATGASVASSTMSGTEAPKESPPAEDIGTGVSDAEQTAQGMDEAKTANRGHMKSSSGKLPEDMAPADNDDALAAQIRYAAESETDPVKKEQLWNEYRKYKGQVPKK